MQSLQIGLRVVRGPHWEWKNIDGGEGHVGTVVEIQGELNGGYPVVIQWDSGSRCRCRCGVAGKYDLRILDSAPAGVQHPHVECTWCGEQGVRGVLWKCVQCIDYHLCSPCYYADKHSVDHRFNRLDTPSSRRARVSPRYSCPRLIARGIFPGAEVERGCDWHWRDQDGGVGSRGKVIKIEGWEGQSGRSVAQVKWRDSRSLNVYRRSHNGKVDLKCTVPAAGGAYYPSHLPVLGAPPPKEDGLLAAGDFVKVEADPDVFKISQEDHGGWDDAMAEYIGRLGVVCSILRTGSAVVRYSNNRVLSLNIDVLVKAHTQLFSFGQTVRMIDDMAKVHQLLKDGPGWNDDIVLSLGQLGQVVHVSPNNNVKVIMKGQKWIVHPDTLEPAPGRTPPEYTAEDIEVNPNLKVEVLSLLKTNCQTDALALAVAAGDVKTVTKYLDTHPEEINTKVEGKGLLHIAIIEGYTPIVKVLLGYNPNLELEDGEGEMPLHITAFSNNADAAKLLLDAGANVNAVNGHGATPITLAAAQGHCEVLEVLVSHHGANLNYQDVDMKTPLHRAVHSYSHKTVRVLLESGADPTLVSLKLFSAAHEAAIVGSLSAVEELMRFHPELINQKKDNGSTWLHVAAANNHFDIVSLLASHPSCSVSMTNTGRLTPLHIAVHEGHIQSVERLVGFGAAVNAIGVDGSTSLHLALGRKNMTPPTNDTPFILKIQEEIEQTHGKGLLCPNYVVGIFLVMQEADLHIKNQLGVSPLKILPPDVGTLVSSYRGKSDSFRGALRELVRPFYNELPKPIRGQHKIHTAPVTSLERNAAGSGHRSVTQTHYPTDVPKSQSFNMFTTGGDQGGAPIMQREDILVRGGAPIMQGGVPNTGAAIQANGGARHTPNAPPSPIPHRIAAGRDLIQCCLCEKGADIKLLPCGHVTLCHTCVTSGQGARRCPEIECRQPVEHRVMVCVFCKQADGLERFAPCGHTVCTGCKSQHTYCLACQVFKDD